MTDKHWAVMVYRNGENILTIESNMLAGRDLSPEDEACIEDCAHQLLSFIGKAALPAVPSQAPKGNNISLKEDRHGSNCVLSDVLDSAGLGPVDRQPPVGLDALSAPADTPRHECVICHEMKVIPTGTVCAQCLAAPADTPCTLEHHRGHVSYFCAGCQEFIQAAPADTPSPSPRKDT
jgi:hypothetical protein